MGGRRVANDGGAARALDTSGEQAPGGATPQERGAFDRLTEAAWPPGLAILAALAVFLIVLRTSPTGLSSLPRFFFAQTAGPAGLAPAYALGAASSLALLTLLGVALLATLVDLVARSARRRR